MKLKYSILVFIILAAFLLTGCFSRTPKIINPDFSKDLTGWDLNAYTKARASASVETFEGKGGTAYIASEGDNDVRLIQELKVTPDSVYRITCIVKTEGVTDGAGANIGVYGVPVTSERVYGDTDWTQIELLGKTAAGQKTLPLSIGVGGHGALSSGKAWFDDIRIERYSGSYKGANIFGTDENVSEDTAKDKTPTKFPTAQILFWCFIATIFMMLIWLWHFLSAKKPFSGQKSGDALPVITILLIALAVRVALSLIFYGHRTDINCFTQWGKRLVTGGPAHFYDNWCDYPPGYMLVLGFMSWIDKLIGRPDPNLTALLVKVPCIIADLASAYIIFRIARKKMDRMPAIALLALVAFTPVMAYVSSAWGQIDQVLTLAIIIPIILLFDRKPILAGLIYGLGIIMKPQALMCGPMFAAAYILYLIKGYPASASTLSSRYNADRIFPVRLLKTVIAVISAFAVIILISLPFRGEQEPLWLIGKYYGTATSYDYATVNAYNFLALINKNWYSLDPAVHGQTATLIKAVGTAAMAVSVIISIGLYVFAAIKHNRGKEALPLTMAYMLAGIFTFGHFMHERYIFPALTLLLLAYLYYNDRRILAVFVCYATTILVNCVAAFYYSELFKLGLYWDKRIIFWCSLANVVLFVFFTWVTFDLIKRNKPMKAFAEKPAVTDNNC